MPPLKKGDLRDEIDSGIRDARKKHKRSRSPVSKARQAGREEAFQVIRECFLDGPLPRGTDEG